MVRSGQDLDEADFEDWLPWEDEQALSHAGIAEQNDGLLRRYREFRQAADAVAAAWRGRPEVVAVAPLQAPSCSPAIAASRPSTSSDAVFHVVTKRTAEPSSSPSFTATPARSRRSTTDLGRRTKTSFAWVG